MLTQLMRGTLALVLTTVLVSQLACGGGNFAMQLRVILAASGPLLDALVSSGAISSTAKSGLITDFADLATGAATLGTDLNACTKGDKACELAGVEKFSHVFESVAARGHLGQNAKLRNIETIVQGIIDSAKIFYGGTPRPGARVGAVPRNDADMSKALDQQLKTLKAAMAPEKH